MRPAGSNGMARACYIHQINRLRKGLSDTVTDYAGTFVIGTIHATAGKTRSFVLPGAQKGAK